MILVTGAGQGIGYECAKALLARTPTDVLITGRRADALHDARASVAPHFRARLLTRVCDQGSREDVEELAALLADEHTALEGAILNVGVNPMYTEGPRHLHSLSTATIDATIRTNCTHTLLLTRALLARFRVQRGGVLIWVGSQAQRLGVRGAGVYCATKSFLSGLASVAHAEYARRGVRVHLMNPALVRTPRTAVVVDGFAAVHGLQVTEAATIARHIVDRFLSDAAAPVEVDL